MQASLRSPVQPRFLRAEAVQRIGSSNALIVVPVQRYRGSTVAVQNTREGGGCGEP